MERKIRERFFFEENLLEVQKRGNGCKNCYFESKRTRKRLCRRYKVYRKVIETCGWCYGFEREDKKGVIFVEVKE